MLITLLCCYTVWLWVMLPTFRKYMLPPFSQGRRSRLMNFCVCTTFCFWKKKREKGEASGDWCVFIPFPEETCRQISVTSPPVSVPLHQQQNSYQRFSWWTGGWVTAQECPLSMGFWWISGPLKGPTAKLSRFTVPIGPDEATIPTRSPFPSFLKKHNTIFTKKLTILHAGTLKMEAICT
jgi:hypothetical protein